ncbi:MAG: hypothetical protein HC819_13940 [Cyclobacteriaceae bacterium]|nr:hypothetical protein [Cyclobacteriaceae bacterium]
MEKENPNLITVFICFLRSGLRFTRYDTNNVGLAFIEEIKKHNPNFTPVKVQQRERDQEYTVNAYPKEFEQLINSLIEEYRIKHKLEYRLKKPKTGGGRGGFNRGGNRPGGYTQNRDQRGTGSTYNRPRRDVSGGGFNVQRRDADGRVGGYRPNRPNQDQSGQGGYRPRYNSDQPGQSGYRPRRDGQGNQEGNRPDGQSGQSNYRPRSSESNYRGQGDGYRPRRDPSVGGDRFTPNIYPRDRDGNKAEERPKRPRRDPDSDQ